MSPRDPSVQADVPVWKRRQVGPEANRAIEKLAHAIEYLIYMHENENSLLVWEEGQLEAVRILKALNRQIYLECPETPSLDERICAFLFRR